MATDGIDEIIQDGYANYTSSLVHARHLFPAVSRRVVLFHHAYGVAAALAADRKHTLVTDYGFAWACSVSAQLGPLFGKEEIVFGFVQQVPAGLVLTYQGFGPDFGD